jgi:DNA-binding CsgD family transcriptional regulator
MSSPSVDDILRLIDSIYDAGAHPERWHAAMTQLADATGNVDATIGGQTSAQVQMLISARADPAYVKTYAEYYHARNPMQMAAHSQPVGTAVLDSQILDVQRFRSSEFYNEWCRPQGFLSGASINLAASGGWRATVMVTGSDEDHAEKLKLLKVVAPHLCRAFQLNQVMHSSRSLGLGAMAALEHADKAAFVVTREGNARAVNGLAERILGMGDGLFIQNGRLVGGRMADTAAIDRAIANCERGLVESSGATFTVTRSAGRSPLDLLCIPFPATEWWPGFEQNIALIFVTDRDAKLEQQTRRLRQRYGLTAAEAALAWEIARTGGRQSAAASRGVSVATARSQLTSIFDKTGVRRQAELVRLLLEDTDES